MPSKAAIPSGIVASNPPFSPGVALQKPNSPPPSFSDGVVAVGVCRATNCVGRTMTVGVDVASWVATAGRGVRVGSGVDVGVGSSVGVGEGTAVGVFVGTGVGVRVGVGVSVGVKVGVSVGVDVDVGVSVGVCVGVAVGTGVSVGVAVYVGVGVIVGVNVGVEVGVEVGSISGKTSENPSIWALSTKTVGGDKASRKRGAPEGSFGSTK